MNPAQHPAHDFPLADRIVDDLISEYIATNLALAAATFGSATPEERGAHEALDQVRHLHLAGWDYRLTPKILDALRRAGLLIDKETSCNP